MIFNLFILKLIPWKIQNTRKAQTHPQLLKIIIEYIHLLENAEAPEVDLNQAVDTVNK